MQRIKILFSVLLMAILVSPCRSALASDEMPVRLQTVQVVATTPLPGSGIDIDKVPGNVQRLSAKDVDDVSGSATLTEAVVKRLASVSLNSQQGNPFQPDFVYRGFEASPISGVGQGLAVYQNGVRINEAFGDTVNWDLIPQVAVNDMTVQSSNTVFGLNALGGAVSIDMKDGFNFRGRTLEMSGGSYGNLSGNGQFSARDGDTAIYAAVSGVEDGGFRYQSHTALRQGYVDIGRQGDRSSLHLSAAIADNDIGAVGPTPVQMLQENFRSVFTYPQTMHNAAQLVALRGSYQAAEHILFSGNVYYRHYLQQLVDGNTTDVQACANNADYFCLEGDYNYPGDALYDANGNQVPTSVLASGATPGEIDTTHTNTKTLGAAVQGVLTAQLLGHDNHLAFGMAIDASRIRYGARGTLATIMPSLETVGAGVIIDQSMSATAQPPIEAPVDLRSLARYYGVYFTDTLDLTARLSWTLSGRFNRAVIALRDQIGTSLDGDHRFDHFNPGTGLTYKISDATTFYAGFGESNRTPTPGELTCADPQRPCLLDAFLVSDPPLKQVVARTVETGLRGRFSSHRLPGRFNWNLGVFRTDNLNDILLLATKTNGFGYYANSGTTRRQGLEAAVGYATEQLEIALSYSLINGSFRSPQVLSTNSPAADANGEIHVRTGDHLPLTPRNRWTLNIDYAATPAWKLGVDLRYTGSQYLLGDESNQEAPLPSATIVGIHSEYQIAKWLQLFGKIDNLFDRRYYTYGTFAGLDGLPPNFSNLDNPRVYSPSPPRTLYAGFKLSF